MNHLKTLKPGDVVEIIAPASRCQDDHLLALKSLLESWDLRVVLAHDIFGEDVLCAHNDEQRFKHLKAALQNPKSQAIICARGGYGSMRLIPQLLNMTAPKEPKLLIGLSDITALHLFLNQNWHWPTLHAHLSSHMVSKASIDAVKKVIFGTETDVQFRNLKPLNERACKNAELHSSMTGGNLTLVQASIGTAWQLQAQNKIVLLEEVGERAYRVDRMLEHMNQAKLFAGASALVFGDFTDCNETDGSSIIDAVLHRFAEDCPFPVLRIEGIGHGSTNMPVPFGTEASLSLGAQEDYLLKVNS